METITPTKAPAEVVRAVFDALARRDPDGLVDLEAPGYVDDIVAIGEFKGREAIRTFFIEVFSAFPDFTMTLDRIIADDSAAAVQWHFEGTFSGTAFQGVRPTGRKVAIRGVDVMDIADGKIQHITIYYDGATFARQIGLLPAKDSPADRALLAAFNATTSVRSRVRRA